MVLALVLAILAFHTPLFGQTKPAPGPAASSDTLFFNAELASVAAGPRGITGGVEWLHVLSPTSSVNTGILSFSLADSTWTYGRAGAMRRLRPPTVVHGQIDMGAGREQRDGFGYFAARGTLSHELMDRRLVLEVQDQYVHINTTVGHSGKVGLTFRPAPRLAVGAAFHSSWGSTLGVQAVTVRIDGYGRGVTVFGGLSTGRWRPALVGLAGQGPAEGMYEIFAGGVIPLESFSLTLALDSLRMAQARKHSIIVSWSLPL